MNIEPLRKKPEELVEWLVKQYSFDLPEEIITIEDMEKASRMLLKLANSFSYLNALLSYAKIATRRAKRECSKEEYEDMVDKKEAISNMADIVKQQYSAVSRAVTIHVENNNELKMTGGV